MSTDPQAVPRPSNRQRLAQRRAEMPIIDAARIPLHTMRQRWPRRAMGLFAWLRVVRPVLVALFWIWTVRYAWTHFFGLPDELPLWQQIALYGVAVGVIALLMLGLAPLRRREVRNEPVNTPGESTFAEMSDFAQVAPHDLVQLQQAQRLVIHHDDAGAMATAEDTDRLLQGRGP